MFSSGFNFFSRQKYVKMNLDASLKLGWKYKLKFISKLSRNNFQYFGYCLKTNKKGKTTVCV